MTEKKYKHKKSDPKAALYEKRRIYLSFWVLPC